MRKVFHVTDYYDGDKMFSVVDGKNVLTPMLMVMVAIAGADVLFALDSIPAIFGLTQNTYIVFTATAFSLLGLRQLFFLIRWTARQAHLPRIRPRRDPRFHRREAHPARAVSFINGGEPGEVVEISTGLSLTVILGVLVVTVVASLLSPRGKAQTAVTRARHLAEQYLSTTYETDAATRAKSYLRLVKEVDAIKRMPEKYRRRIREETDLMDLLHRAEAEHEARVAAGLAPP